ncbi:MAG TPA: hypothetical protein VL501_01425 [Pyrinomonadaceae bacterium]|nr:hypothetical protein [Pyrinomonadaceae bacterium]
MKKFELVFEVRPGYLYACVTAGKIDRPTALTYLRKIAEQVKAHATDRLLIERDIPVMLEPADLFFTAQDFIEMVGRTRVAFVNKHASIHEEMQFGVMIGTNRGASYRLFHNVADAEEWLLAAK